jgi:hypothetical protein
MDGETIDMWKKGELKVEEFEIVRRSIHTRNRNRETLLHLGDQVWS